MHPLLLLLLHLPHPGWWRWQEPQQGCVLLVLLVQQQRPLLHSEMQGWVLLLTHMHCHHLLSKPGPRGPLHLAQQRHLAQLGQVAGVLSLLLLRLLHLQQPAAAVLLLHPQPWVPGPLAPLLLLLLLLAPPPAAAAAAEVGVPLGLYLARVAV